MAFNYYDLSESELRTITFGEIIKNPIAIIFYLFCLWIFASWVMYSVRYIMEKE